jgi:hypothetical protein
MGKIPVSLACFCGSTALVGLGLLIVEILGSHLIKPTTFGRATLEKYSARLGDLYLTTHITHRRQISIQLRDSNPQS